jgi:hypothetical protein
VSRCSPSTCPAAQCSWPIPSWVLTITIWFIVCGDEHASDEQSQRTHIYIRLQRRARGAQKMLSIQLKQGLARLVVSHTCGCWGLPSCPTLGHACAYSSSPTSPLACNTGHSCVLVIWLSFWVHVPLEAWFACLYCWLVLACHFYVSDAKQYQGS